MNKADAIAFGSNLQAVGDTGLLEGYLVPFTSIEDPDTHGEWFDKHTDLGLDRPGWGIVGKPVLYSHATDPAVGPDSIGVFVKSRIDELGLWVQAQIDLANQYGRAVYELVKKGLLKVGWSSGAHRKSLLVDKSTGYIRRWYMVEGSITPMPAKPFSTAIVATKSLHDTGVSLDRLLQTARGDGPDGSEDGETGLNGEGQKSGHTGKESIMNKLHGLALKVAKHKGLEFSSGELSAMAADVAGVLPTEAALIEGATAESIKSDAGVISAIDRVASLFAERMVTAMAVRESDLFADVNVEKAFTGAQTVPSARTFAGGAQHTGNGQGPTQRPTAAASIPHLRLKSLLGRLSPEALSFAIDMDAQAQRIPGARGMRWAHDPGAQAVGANIAKSVFAAHALEQANKGEFEFESDDHFEKAVVLKELGEKANEINGSTVTGYGDEWVPTSWAGMIWPRVRRENVVAPLLNPFEMNAAIVPWPTDGSDGTPKFVAERVNVTQYDSPADNAERVGTDSVIFDTSNKKLQRQVLLSRELFEDSIIRADTQFEMQARRSVMDGVDYVILNGDTEAGMTNINKDGAASAASDRWMMLDGIIKYALASTGHDFGGAAPILQELTTALYLMDDEIVGQDNDDVVMFTHSAVFGRLLNLGEMSTHDKLGAAGSAVTGIVRKILGAEVKVSAQLPKSASNGKISNTGANNTLGRVVFVHKPSWKLGYRRQVGSYLARAQDGEAYLLTVTTRFDVKQHSNEGGASLGYNIAVA